MGGRGAYGGEGQKGIVYAYEWMKEEQQEEKEEEEKEEDCYTIKNKCMHLIHSARLQYEMGKVQFFLCSIYRVY